MWLLPSLRLGIKLHSRKIKFVLSSCIIYYSCSVDLKLPLNKTCWRHSPDINECLIFETELDIILCLDISFYENSCLESKLYDLKTRVYIFETKVYIFPICFCYIIIKRFLEWCHSPKQNRAGSKIVQSQESR